MVTKDVGKAAKLSEEAFWLFESACKNNIILETVK